MLEGPFALAVAAGMAATVNPCGFALLPAYLAAFVGEDHEPGVGAVPRAFAVSAALTAGFVVVFGLFGAVISPLAVSVEQYLPWATIVIGIALVGLGGWLLAGRELVLHIPKLNRGGRDGSLLSMFLFGVSYAVASLSCTIGPFLAVTSSTFSSRDVASGIGVFVAYALGMGAVVTALTVSVALARAGLAGRLRAALPYVSRFSGVLLVVAGAYVAWYGWFEVRTLSGGDGSDPIVDRAVELQSWLQRTLVPDDAVTGLVAVTVVLAAVGAIVGWHRHRSTRLLQDQVDGDGVMGAQTAPTVPGPECAPTEGPTSYRVSLTTPEAPANASATPTRND
ncbi:MAG: cytochrome c biogenesis CcdA family protein [Acidimicrobiales bacterium]